MPPRKGIGIKLGDGKQRTLRYSHDVLERLEEESGKTVVEWAQRLPALSALAIGWLVWAGIIHTDPKITRQAVRDILDAREYRTYAEAIAAAVRESIGGQEAGEPEGNEEGGAV